MVSFPVHPRRVPSHLWKRAKVKLVASFVDLFFLQLEARRPIRKSHSSTIIWRVGPKSSFNFNVSQSRRKCWCHSSKRVSTALTIPSTISSGVRLNIAVCISRSVSEWLSAACRFVETNRSHRCNARRCRGRAQGTARTDQRGRCRRRRVDIKEHHKP